MQSFMITNQKLPVDPNLVKTLTTSPQSTRVVRVQHKAEELSSLQQLPNVFVFGLPNEPIGDDFLNLVEHMPRFPVGDLDERCSNMLWVRAAIKYINQDVVKFHLRVVETQAPNLVQVQTSVTDGETSAGHIIKQLDEKVAEKLLNANINSLEKLQSVVNGDVKVDGIGPKKIEHIKEVMSG